MQIMNRKQKPTKSVIPRSSNILGADSEEVHGPLLLRQVDQAAVVVFSTRPCYPWKLNLCCFLSILISFLKSLYLDLTYSGGDAKIQQMLHRVVWFAFGLVAILLLGLLLFLPRQYQVLSDSSIVVQSALTSFKFGNIQDAHRKSGLCDGMAQLRWDFALEFTNRVFVERAGNGWPVWCSPQDPDGFVDAIRHVCNSNNDFTVDKTMMQVQDLV
jgi:hypothetical protein